MGDDFYIPMMSQDLMTSSMGMMSPYGMYGMPYMYGGMMGAMPIPSPVLGAIRMQAQPPADQFIASQKKQETKNTFIKAGIAFAALVALACIPGKKGAGKFTEKIGDFFERIKFKKRLPVTPPATPPVTP